MKNLNNNPSPNPAMDKLWGSIHNAIPAKVPDEWNDKHFADIKWNLWFSAWRLKNKILFLNTK